MKLRFVVPWYGKNIPGGAELACRLTAENLHIKGFNVEVLTTCAKDCYNWNNYHPPGKSEINGVIVNRFIADKRNSTDFDQINSKLIRNLPINSNEEHVFIKEMINSSSMYDYIEKNNNGVYFFIPYMFGTTFYGSQINPDISYLIPCLHNESYAYLNVYKKMFTKVKGVVSLTKPEQLLTNKLFNVKEKEQALIGLGVELKTQPNPKRFRNKYKIQDDFILYVGRKEPGKNVPLLIDYFIKYKNSVHKNIKLVLIGGGKINIPKDSTKDILDLGFIPEDDKFDAFSAALLHCQPSINESFSFSIMESWLCKRPVLVHENCAVTKEHCIKSNGGLYFNDSYSFLECLDLLSNNQNINQNLGYNGCVYVKTNYNWTNIANKYNQLVNKDAN